MFVARWIVEALIGAKDSGHVRVIETLSAARKIELAAKDSEIVLLRGHVADLRAALQTEIARTHALTDRLLVKEAKVYPVQPVVTAAMEAAAKNVEDITKKTSRLFESMNEVGEDSASTEEATATEIGGGRVLTGASKPMPRPSKRVE